LKSRGRIWTAWGRGKKKKCHAGCLKEEGGIPKRNGGAVSPPFVGQGKTHTD